MMVVYKLDLNDKDIVMTYKVPNAHMDWVTAIVISKFQENGEGDTRRIFSGGNDHNIIAWSVDFISGSATSLFTMSQSAGITHFSLLVCHKVSGAVVLLTQHSFTVWVSSYFRLVIWFPHQLMVIWQSGIRNLSTVNA